MNTNATPTRNTLAIFIKDTGTAAIAAFSFKTPRFYWDIDKGLSEVMHKPVAEPTADDVVKYFMQRCIFKPVSLNVMSAFQRQVDLLDATGNSYPKPVEIKIETPLTSNVRITYLGSKTILSNDSMVLHSVLLDTDLDMAGFKFDGNDYLPRCSLVNLPDFYIQRALQTVDRDGLVVPETYNYMEAMLRKIDGQINQNDHVTTHAETTD